MKKSAKDPVKFKISYLREIDRNAMLFATQPKPRIYKDIFETPVDVLGRVVVVLSKALERAVGKFKMVERVEKEVKKKSKGKTPEQIEVIRLMERVKSAASMWKGDNKALMDVVMKKGRRTDG